MIARASRVRTRGTQIALRKMLEILSRAEAATGSPLDAYAWFRFQPLPASAERHPDCRYKRRGPTSVRVSRPWEGVRVCMTLCRPVGFQDLEYWEHNLQLSWTLMSGTGLMEWLRIDRRRVSTPTPHA